MPNTLGRTFVQNLRICSRSNTWPQGCLIVVTARWPGWHVGHPQAEDAIDGDDHAIARFDQVDDAGFHALRLVPLTGKVNWLAVWYVRRRRSCVSFMIRESADPGGPGGSAPSAASTRGWASLGPGPMSTRRGGLSCPGRFIPVHSCWVGRLVTSSTLSVYRHSVGARLYSCLKLLHAALDQLADFLELRARDPPSHSNTAVSHVVKIAPSLQPPECDVVIQVYRLPSVSTARKTWKSRASKSRAVCKTHTCVSMPTRMTLILASRPNASINSGTAQQLKAVLSHGLGISGSKLGSVPPSPLGIAPWPAPAFRQCERLPAEKGKILYEACSRNFGQQFLLHIDNQCAVSVVTCGGVGIKDPLADRLSGLGSHAAATGRSPASYAAKGLLS